LFAEDRPRAGQAWEQRLQGRNEQDTQWRLRHRDGHAVWVCASAPTIADADGTFAGAFAMVTDITDRKRVEAELAVARRQLAASQESERLRLARELHDGAMQQLYGLSYQLAEGQRRARLGEAGTTLASALETLRRDMLGVVAHLRGLVGGLRPPGLVKFGLPAALSGYIAQLQRERGAGGPAIALELDPAPLTLPEPVALALFRIAQEAVRNALRHAQARRIRIVLGQRAGEIVLRVHDDGRGFHVPAHLSTLTIAGHFGLAGLAERVELVGGELAIESAPGAGTTVTVRVPLPQDEPSEERGAHGHPDPRTLGR